MGLLDKVESNETKAPKKASAKAVKAAKVAEAVPVAEKPAKPKKEKKPKVKKPRPASLSSEFEIAPKLSRVISWWVNFIANFSVLIAGLVMSALTGGSSGGLETTILFIVAIIVLFFNAIFLPIYTGRNLGQYTSSTRYIRGDGSKPLFLHSLFVNNIGLLSLVGFIMVFVQVGQISGGGTTPIVMTSIGSVLMILWIVNWQFSRNSELDQGLFDLMFAAYLVRYVPEEKATSGFRARLESMSQFGERYAKRVEERAKIREEKSSEKDSAEESSESSEETTED
ncbi:MAG: hypothetical protein VXV89_07605 [Candidatus Thermoplasmatota archaeon]|nr:hypothetical protein [Candidatus Thermoplasmatota archaeon]